MRQFRDNKDESRFEWEEGGYLSVADYADKEGVRSILYVETPVEARGRGYAEHLMNAIVRDARANGVKLRPICGYAAAHFRRHPDTHDVLA
jgi:predicted GNAT family acetyltransferase